MEYLKNIKAALKEVYSKRGYFILSLIVSFMIFSFNVLINNYKLLFKQLSVKLFFLLLKGAFETINKVSLVFLLLMSILAGIVISMSIFLVKRQIKGSAETGFFSMVLSVIAPSCPSCAIGLLSVLGLGSFIAVLPFKGAELGVVGVGGLLLSLIYISNKVVSKVCKI